MFETPGERMSRKWNPRTFSRSRTAIPVSFEVTAETLQEFYNQLGETDFSEEFSLWVKRTKPEICTCTGYSEVLQGQVEMLPLSPSGNDAGNNSVGPRCVECGRVRPYQLTALSTF